MMKILVFSIMFSLIFISSCKKSGTSTSSTSKANTTGNTSLGIQPSLPSSGGLVDDGTVSGSFTSTTRSTVNGSIAVSVSGVSIPFQIQDQNGNVLYSGSTDSSGSFSVKLSSYVSAGDFYEPKLYAAAYDSQAESFASSYSLVDDNFLCDVDDSNYNPSPNCLGLVVGSFTMQASMNNALLYGMCHEDDNQLNVDIPRGYIKSLKIDYSRQAGPCGSDSELDDLYVKFWILDTWTGDNFVTSANSAFSINKDSNYMRVFNMSPSWNDIVIHSITVEYSNF